MITEIIIVAKIQYPSLPAIGAMAKFVIVNAITGTNIGNNLFFYYIVSSSIIHKYWHTHSTK